MGFKFFLVGFSVNICVANRHQFSNSSVDPDVNSVSIFATNHRADTEHAARNASHDSFRSAVAAARLHPPLADVGWAVRHCDVTSVDDYCYNFLRCR